MSKEVEITIDADANIELEAFGYKGKGCAEVIDELSKSLGKKIEMKNKAEYHQPEDTKIKQKISRF